MPDTRSIRTFAIIAAAALLTFAEVKAQAAEVSYKYATVPAGAEAIRTLVPAAEVHNYDTGHFALEEDHVDIAKQIKRFFAPAVAQQPPK